MKIEIEDTLDDRVNTAIERVQELLVNYLNDNKVDTVPCLHNDLDYDGSVSEIVDSSVPIYTSEIRDLWYLYDTEFEAAYENAGVVTNPRENHGMSAIYFYIFEKVNEWYFNNAEDIFDEWEKENLSEDEDDE